LALFHFGAVIDVHRADIARELRSDIDGHEGAHGAGRRDQAPQIVTLGRGRLDIEPSGGLVLPVIIGAASRRRGDQKDQQPTSCHAFSPWPIADNTKAGQESVTKRQ
jgi:hypothetical protein